MKKNNGVFTIFKEDFNDEDWLTICKQVNMDAYDTTRIEVYPRKVKGAGNCFEGQVVFSKESQEEEEEEEDEYVHHYTDVTFYPNVLNGINIRPKVIESFNEDGLEVFSIMGNLIVAQRKGDDLYLIKNKENLIGDEFPLGLVFHENYFNDSMGAIAYEGLEGVKESRSEEDYELFKIMVNQFCKLEDEIELKDADELVFKYNSRKITEMLF